MAKSNTIRINDDNWIKESVLTSMRDKHVKSQGLSIKGDDLILVPGSKVDFDIVVPQGASADTVKTAAAKVLSRFQIKIKENYDKTLAKIAELKKGEEKNKNAGTQAKSLVEKANKFIDDLFLVLRADVRAAVASALGGDVKAKQLETIGSKTFNKMKLPTFAFEGGLDVDEGAADQYEDLKKALGLQGWQYCGVVAAQTAALVLISGRKKQPRDPDLKLLRKAVAGNAALLKGICKSSGTSIDFRFLKNDKAPRKSVVRDGLNDQVGKKFTVTIKGELSKIPDANELKKFKDGAESSGPPESGK